MDEKLVIRYLKEYIQSVKSMRKDGIFIPTSTGGICSTRDPEHNVPGAFIVKFTDPNILEAIEYIKNNTLMDGVLFNRVITGGARTQKIDHVAKQVDELESKGGLWRPLQCTDTTKLCKDMIDVFNNYIKRSSDKTMLRLDIPDEYIDIWTSKGNTKFTINMKKIFPDIPEVHCLKLTNRMLINLHKKRTEKISIEITEPSVHDSTSILSVIIQNIDCITIAHYAFLYV